MRDIDPLPPGPPGEPIPLPDPDPQPLPEPDPEPLLRVVGVLLPFRRSSAPPGDDPAPLAA